MNPKTFPFKTIREFAASRMIRKGNRLVAVEAFETASDVAPAHTTVTFHRTFEIASRVAKSNMKGGYSGILKSGRVEENEPAK